MKKPAWKQLLSAATGCWVMSTTGIACGVPDDTRIDPGSIDNTRVSFAEFEARTYREPETGIYIVDGDTPVATREELRLLWEQHVQPGGLAIRNYYGGTNYLHDYSWSLAQQRTLRYCVSYTFGSNYGRVAAAMTAAAADWAEAANVQFIHRVDQDSDCTSSNTHVVFDVNPTSGQQYFARAFSPPYVFANRANQNILIDSSALGDITPLTLTGVLRHELGHTLGFRHEHARPEAASGNCIEEGSDWRPLTPYDSASVMHYPQCSGTNQGDYALTAQDRAGAAAKYGPKGSSCRPTALSWSAQSLPHIIGRADADGWSANVTQDPVGHLQYGPYTTQVIAGAHTAVWNLMIDNNSATNQLVALLDVVDATTGGTVLASRELMRKEWSSAYQYQSFTVPFTLDSSRVGHALEFRVRWYKTAYVRLHSVYLDPECL